MKKVYDIAGITPRSVEEAGHALMCAYVGFRFSKVRINSKTKPRSIGGSVGVVFHMHKLSEDYVRKHALVQMAGEAARRAIFPEDTHRSMPDEARVVCLYYQLEQFDVPFESLAKEADKIFQNESIRGAIRYVAVILELEHKISEKEVRNALRSAQEMERRKVSIA